MRVIAGKYKGRTLIAPQGLDTRPTLDRTKETLFNILNFKLRNAAVLDLFAGSGQLAIESLSRGSARAVVCDSDKRAAESIKANFAKIGVKEEMYFCDYRVCLNTVNGEFDVIFVDPPYGRGLYADVMRLILANGLLKSDGIIVCEQSAESELIDVSGLEAYDIRRIGSVKFVFYRKTSIYSGEIK